MQGQCEKAFTKSEEIVANHPNAATQIHVLGMANQCMGIPEEAISLYKKAFRLNPYPPTYFIKNIGEAFFMAGRFEELIEFINKWIYLRPDPFWLQWSHIHLAAAYSLIGREKDAKMEVAKAIKVDPKTSLELIEQNVLLYNKDDINRYIIALRKVGMPE